MYGWQSPQGRRVLANRGPGVRVYLLTVSRPGGSACANRPGEISRRAGCGYEPS